jgi:Ca-activated chloride channel family protein
MSEFHFIRPWWLLAIVVLIIMLFLLKKYRLSQSGWHQFLPKHLAAVLVDGKSQTKALSLTLPFIIGLLSILALAGPSWQKLPQPVYQVARGSVLIMDMSYSMYSTDVTPNRLTRARYKAIDLLENINEGELGLIAYAGDAFIISPLTDDINNIKLLLPSLTPELMPELGSNPLAALTLAHEMLLNAGHNEGDIYWFTDGIDNIDTQDITQWSRKHPYRLNVLGIGTTAGAPIKLVNGELMKDRNGAIIIPKLTDRALKGVADRGRGNYVTLAHNNSDIEQLIQQPSLEESERSAQTDNTGDQWQEFGPYLLLLVLPLMLGYFRRGTLLAVLPPGILLGLLFSPSQPVHADIWQDLWKTKDQQGKQHFEQQQFEQAAQQFEDPLWQGTSHYKAGNYEQALAAFQQHDSAQALFNQGNALAKLQKFDEAIASYQQALSKDPNLTDAKSNKELLEQLKQQQEQQNQDNQDDKEQTDDSEESQQDQQQGQENSEPQDGQENQQQNDQSGQPSEDQEQKNSEADDTKNDQQQEQNNQGNDEQQEQETKEQEAQQGAENKDAVEEESEQQMSAEAKLAAEQQAKETEQKHQQLLNKVTDDPYMLLRNKMQLEYQKRRQDRSNVGVQKKW